MLVAVAVAALGSLCWSSAVFRKDRRQACEGVDDAPHTGRRSGPDRQLDQRHLHAARAAGQIAGKEFFTPEEADGVRQIARRELNSQAADDIHYDNALWQTENYKKGVRACARRSSSIRPTAGLPALTEAARNRRRVRSSARRRRRRRADSYENRTLAERCITWGNDGPPMMPVGYNANLDILQGPGTSSSATR